MKLAYITASSLGMTTPARTVYGLAPAFEVEFVDGLGVTRKGLLPLGAQEMTV